MFTIYNIIYIIVVKRKYHVTLLYMEYEFMRIRSIVLLNKVFDPLTLSTIFHDSRTYDVLEFNCSLISKDSSTIELSTIYNNYDMHSGKSLWRARTEERKKKMCYVITYLIWT